MCKFPSKFIYLKIVLKKRKKKKSTILELMHFIIVYICPLCRREKGKLREGAIITTSKRGGERLLLQG